MKITLEEVADISDVEIIVRCTKITAEINEMIAELRLYNRTMSGKKGNDTYIINFSDILYFDTTDRKTFIYTRDGIYETILKLSRIEEITSDTSFVRVSKSCIINLKSVQRLSSSLYGKILAHLENGEKIEISRMYVSYVKQKIGLEGGDSDA